MAPRNSEIVKVLSRRLKKKINEPFHILSLRDVRLKYRRWMQAMPRVIPYYAVKCNDHPEVLRTLKEAGAGFDCASPTEISQVLTLGSDKIVYTHIAKQVSDIKYAAENKIQKLTFDSREELLKIKKFHPSAEVVLRIRFSDETSICVMGEKFGCDPTFEAPKLINLCKKLEMNLIGISFHVGSGTKNFEIFYCALAEVAKLFAFAERVGLDLSLVDIGGGFLGDNKNYLKSYAKFINAGIEEFFPDPKVSIISEPGRFFVDTAGKVAAQIVLKKKKSDGRIHYYTNDGIHMSFLIRHVFKDYAIKFSIVRKKPQKNSAKFRSVIYGVSCNPSDVIVEESEMPEMEAGDWLIFHNMGAYSLTTASKFNGFGIGDVVMVD